MQIDTNTPQSNNKQSSVAFDTLLSSLLYILGYYGKRHSVESLVSGLPLKNNKLTPALFIRAAKRAGFKSQVLKRDVAKISPYILPAVVILKGGDSVILQSVLNDGTGEIYDPNNQKVFHIKLDELENKSTGNILVVKQSAASELKSDIGDSGAWFWSTLSQFSKIFWQVLFASVLINLFAITTPMFVMNVYDRVLPNGVSSAPTLWVLAIGIFIIYFFDFVFKQLRGYFIDVAGRGADILMGGRLFQQVLNIRLGQQGASSGAFASRVRDFESLREFFTSMTMVAFIDLPFLFLFVGVIALIGGPLALVPLTAIPVVIIISYFIQSPVKAIAAQSAAQSSAKQGHLIETVSGIEIIKATNAQSRMQAKWEDAVGASARIALRSKFFAMLAINFSGFVQQFVYAAMVVVGVYLIFDGKLAMGSLIACTILSGRTLAPLAQVAALSSRLHQSIEALKGLNEIMAMEVERPEGKDFVQLPNLKGAIELKNVAFKYPGAEINSLNNLNIKINPGEKVGFIGRIGSGKSTIARLLLNLYNPLEGSIMLDNLEIRQLDPAEVRNKISYVPQDSVLFTGTVRENIMIGNPYATDERFLAAATLAGVTDFTQRHPKGFDMQVGELGRALSGGQRQAVSIARALVKDASIMILDEPTSNMDNSSENNLLGNFAKAFKDKTILVVTHRASMLQLVDRLVIMDGGTIVADGPKEAVLRQLSTTGVKGK